MQHHCPYPRAALQFVQEGLSYTASRIHQRTDFDMAMMDEIDRHISGQQLCIGLRDFAIECYGMLAPAVLNHWNIRRTEDFGRIVFQLVDEGVLTKTDEDSLDDFRSVYDFDEVFADDQLVECIGRG